MSRTFPIYLITAVVFLIAAVSSVRAEDVGAGYAAVYAPEAAFEVCRGNTAGEAMECAIKACAAEVGSANDCYTLVACDAGGWVGIMGVMLEEIHFTTASCGAPTREAVVAEMKTRCAGYLPHMQECWLSRVIPLHGDDADGEEVEISWSKADFEG